MAVVTGATCFQMRPRSASRMVGAVDAVLARQLPLRCATSEEVNARANLSSDSGLYDALKHALKTTVYSTVYGMPEANIAGQFTRETKDVVGGDAGNRLRSHPIISKLLDCRETKRRDIVLEGRLRTPTSIKAELDLPDDRNPRNVLATAAQSYELYFVSLILQYERHPDRSYDHGEALNE